MSGFLLDTNVISELIKPKPEPKVTAWVEGTDEQLLYLSVLTLGEIRKGITAVSAPARRVMLEAWLERHLILRFAGRILPVTETVADRWGILSGRALLGGHPLAVIDGLLAATALEHNLTLITRNLKDVSTTGVQTFSPWA